MAVKTKETYRTLAHMYDDVMRDVDYEGWADYVDDIIQKHNPDTVSILELAAGTGTMALSLEELDCYDITATDKSAEMISVAKEKGEKVYSDITWDVVDFLDIKITNTFDAIVILFDSVNYLRKKNEVVKMLNQIKKVMAPHSLLIFDFTTPNYSPKVEKDLNERRRTKSWNYERISSYNKSTKTHLNRFNIQLLDEDGEVAQEFTEDHLQRAWTLPEMEEIIAQTDLTILAKYPDFEFINANTFSDRITMVLQCPQTR